MLCQNTADNPWTSKDNNLDERSKNVPVHEILNLKSESEVESVWNCELEWPQK